MVLVFISKGSIRSCEPISRLHDSGIAAVIWLVMFQWDNQPNDGWFGCVHMLFNVWKWSNVVQQHTNETNSCFQFSTFFFFSLDLHFSSIYSFLSFLFFYVSLLSDDDYSNLDSFGSIDKIFNERTRKRRNQSRLHFVWSRPHHI